LDIIFSSFGRECQKWRFPKARYRKEDRMKKFRRLFFVYAIVLLLIVGAPISVFAGDKPSGKPFEAIWDELEKLQIQIDGFQSQIDDLQAQIDDLNAQLEDEIAARISADENLQNQIDDLQVQIDDLQTQIDDLQDQIDDLQAQITAEEKARIAADEKLQENIDAEEEARIAADDELQEDIDNEETARIAADNGLQNQIDNHKHAGEDITSGKIANARLNMGHGEGLDADTVDGMHASEFSSKWSASGSDIYYNDGNVGIGTARPLTNLYIQESSTLDRDMLTLYSNVNPGNKFGIVFGIGDGGQIEGGAIRLERSDAPGGGDLSFWTSPASGINATQKMVISSDGNVGIGTAEPHGLIHGSGDAGGFMFWEYDGVDDNTISIIPDGPGDVERFVSYTCFALENTGPNGRSTSGSMSPGVTNYIFSDGTDTLVLECALDGSLTIYRESGSDTFEVVLWLMWL
jgi:chaperonin cofactor prefoldin